MVFCLRIHPRDKQDVAYRLTLGARAVAYNEEGVHFLGPFPIQILVNNTNVSVTYDQAISVTLSKDVFEVRLAAGSHCVLTYLLWNYLLAMDLYSLTLL